MNIDLAEFASNNRPPTDSELEQLKEFLGPGESKLAQLEKQIKFNIDENERLWKEKKALMKELRHARAAKSWIRRLPTEIMGAIFLHARAPKDGYASFRVCDAPLVLLRVCRSWRDIALNTPALWSSINLMIPYTVMLLKLPPNSDDERRQASFLLEVDRWLERSAPLPLAIRIRKGEHFAGAPAAYLEVLYSALLKLIAHSHRWETLDFESLSETLRAFRNGIPTPHLKNLRITDHGWHTAHANDGDGPRTLYECHTPFDSPILQRLIIASNEDSARVFSSLPVRWTNLTALTIAPMYPRTPSLGSWGPPSPSMTIGLLPVLSKCVNLRQLFLSLPHNAPPSTGNSPVSLPSLAALSLEGCCEEMDAFLTLVETPTIREFHYYPGYDLSPHATSSFLDLIHKHSDQLEVLGFDLPTISDSEFTACLHNASSLKQLSVGPDRFENKFGSPPVYPFHNSKKPLVFTDSHLTALTPREGEKCLCPMLGVLRCAVKTNVTPELVLHFLKAKFDSGLRQSTNGVRAPFKELSLVHLPLEYPMSTILYRPYMDPDESFDDDPMKVFREAGVVLDWARPNYLNPSGYHGAYVERLTQYETDFRH